MVQARLVVAVLHKLLETVLLAVFLAAGVGELVNPSGPHENTNDVWGVLKAGVLQERIPCEKHRTEQKEQVLNHCKQALNMLLKYYLLVFDLNFIKDYNKHVAASLTTRSGRSLSGVLDNSVLDLVRYLGCDTID